MTRTRIPGLTQAPPPMKLNPRTVSHSGGLKIFRVSAVDKGWWVYLLDHRPDVVALYSGCTPVTTSSESQPSIPLIDTAPDTFNSLSTSVASSSTNKALSSSTVSMFTPLSAETSHVHETTTTASNTIPSTSHAENKLQKLAGKNVLTGVLPRKKKYK
ncbi:hypothetical protein TNCV_3242701 [Trichonephila clavipes]|nr:hypothetical protein TNCV_3242701 [Trichonephila clavipes]